MCPLSAYFPIIAMSLFLVDFQTTIINTSYGVLYACADDLGGALLRITSLLILLRFFKVMAAVAGLVPQATKNVSSPYL